MGGLGGAGYPGLLCSVRRFFLLALLGVCSGASAGRVSSCWVLAGLAGLSRQSYDGSLGFQRLGIHSFISPSVLLCLCFACPQLAKPRDLLPGDSSEGLGFFFNPLYLVASFVSWLSAYTPDGLVFCRRCMRLANPQRLRFFSW